MRWASTAKIGNVPLISVATGPCSDRGERRGWAKGIIAFGDIATGVVAIGGIAFGVIPLGGVSVGLCAFGGLGVGLIAYGGLAVALVAVGGLAVGWYAMGGAAFGFHAISAAAGAACDPEAVNFFGTWLPGMGISGDTPGVPSPPDP